MGKTLPCLLTHHAVLSPEKTKRLVDLKEYRVELAGNMSEAWELMRQCIRKAQKKQKDYYDRKGRSPNFRIGERMFLFKPADKTRQAWKFSRPFHGPFRIVHLDSNTARIKRTDRLEEEAILIAVTSSLPVGSARIILAT